MSGQPRDRDNDTNRARTPTKRQRVLEMTIFLLASVVGIYGIGKGLAGFFERGQEVSLLWLAVTGLALFVLFAQMGRVHDTWPHRPGAPGRAGKIATNAPPAANTQASAHDESSAAERK